MATDHSPWDEPFFREYAFRKMGLQRSRKRAAHLQNLLGIDKPSVPILIIVGSKGKGTTVAYAAATLAAAGLKVGTLTSPSMITNRERIRINGHAISEIELKSLSEMLASCLATMPPPAQDGGYLAPTGLFTLLGVRHMLNQQCDVLVLEAGMGGRSDEVSLFSPTVVAITSVFAEHVGLIGANAAEIAANKAGVITENTRRVLSLSQSPEVAENIQRLAGERLQFVLDESSDSDLFRTLRLPAGLSQMNAKLGVRAALEMLKCIGRNPPAVEALSRILAKVRTPGRLSVHEYGDQLWIVDAAINVTGAQIAMEWCRENVRSPDTILVSLSDDKDIRGVQEVLSGTNYVPVVLRAPHLRYNQDLWPRRFVEVEDAFKNAKGKVVLAIGTMSFVAIILKKVGVNFEVLFDVD